MPSIYAYTGSGGISVSGPLDNIVDYVYMACGSGISISGSADASNHSDVNQGGSTAYTYVGSGGLSLSGPGDDIVDYAYCGEPGVSVTIGGTAQSGNDGIVLTANLLYTARGGVVTGGQAEQVFAAYNYTMNGGIDLAGQAAIQNEILIDFPIGWNTYAIVNIDIPIGWNTGNTPLYFFRVEGVCESLQCPPLADPDVENKNCTYSFIQNIVASNVCDVCTQLADSRFLRTIKSIKQYSNPARESDIRAFEAEGKIDPFCNNLTPVDFCQCLPCGQFCDQESVVQGSTTVVTTQESSVINGYKVTYELKTIRNRQGRIVEQYYYPIYTPEYITLITTTTTTKPSYTVLTTGRVRIGGEAIVSWKPNEIPITAEEGMIFTGCGCNVPMQIYFTHDLTRTSKLGDFLKKNALTLPRTASLFYSSLNKAWYTNLLFNGVGLDGSSQERWSLMFSMECTNVVDGKADPGNPYYWKLVMLIRQHNLTKNKVMDTRLQVNMKDAGPCERGDLNVLAYLNVRTVSVLPIDPPKISLGASLSDKIGLFQGPAWFSNPRFFVGLTVHDVVNTNNNILFGPLYPQIEVSRLN